MLRCAVGVLAALLLGSGVAGANVTRPTPSHRLSLGHYGWMAPDANPQHPWLYVAGYKNSLVEIHDLSRVGVPKIGRISDGIRKPDGITLDRQGNLYVANQNAGDVTIYEAGSTTPNMTLSMGLQEPTCVAVAANGDVYVGNRSPSAPSIVVYPQGQTTPSAIIASPLITNPIAEFFDAGGNLYFSDFNAGVSMIPSGSQTPQSLGLQGVAYAQGIALDPSDGNLFVNVDEGGRSNYKTLVFPAGNVNPSRVLKRGNIAANYIAIGAVKRASSVVFLPNGFSNTVQTWKHGAKPWLTITTGAQGAEGIAYKPAGVP
jgi:hypothetical protein